MCVDRHDETPHTQQQQQRLGRVCGGGACLCHTTSAAATAAGMMLSAQLMSFLVETQPGSIKQLLTGPQQQLCRHNPSHHAAFPVPPCCSLAHADHCSRQDLVPLCQVQGGAMQRQLQVRPSTTAPAAAAPRQQMPWLRCQSAHIAVLSCSSRLCLPQRPHTGLHSHLRLSTCVLCPCRVGVPCLPVCSENIQSRSLTAPLEVLVATPTRLTKVLEHGRVALGDVRW